MPKRPTPPHAGGFGNWKTIDEKPGGAVGQTLPKSCGPACGEMVSGIPQAKLIQTGMTSPELGSHAELLAKAMGPSWKGGFVPDGSLGKLMASGRPWIAQVKDGGYSHFVVVDGERAGAFFIRDPWNGGSTYWISREEFTRIWQTIAVFQ